MASSKVNGNSKVFNDLVSTASALDPTGVSGFILGSMKSIFSIRDRVYISKFEKFWSAFEENKIKVDEFIRKTLEQKDWQKVGENFLLVMDSFSAFDKSYYYGKVWIGWLKEEINTEEMMEMTTILQMVSSNILEKLLYDKRPWSCYDQSRIEVCGIARIISGGFDSPEEVSEMLSGPQSLSNLGKKLIKILKSNLPSK